MTRSNKTYLIGGLLAVLAISSGVGTFTGAPGDNIEERPMNGQSMVSGADYPPSVENTTDDADTTPTSTEQPTTEVTETTTPTPETAEEQASGTHVLSMTAEAGLDITHPVVLENGTLQFTDEGPTATSLPGTNAATTYSVTNNGSKTVDVTITVEFEPRGGGDPVTTLTDTHTIAPGETLTVTRSINVANYTDE